MPETAQEEQKCEPEIYEDYGKNYESKENIKKRIIEQDLYFEKRTRIKSKYQYHGNIKGVIEQTGRVYLPDGCCPTVTACGGGGQQPKILQVEL